ncbi:MAG: restriction endonuclease subunit S, partial [Prevotella sp.]|nr:restriction endonuclease subunit S [Prevotella sp.]
AFAGDDLYTNEAIIAIPENEKYILRFIYYYLLSYDWLSLTEGNEKVKGATLNKSSIGKIQLPILSLSEQQSIVDYLDSAFAKIDAMKANAEKALNEAKALFQASLKEMLEPKEGWEDKKLGEICSDIRYGTSTPSHENGEYKYLRMNNITNDGFLDVSHYKTISLPSKELEKCLVKKGDIIFNRTNSRELVGKSCVFTEDENMVIAGYLIRIRLKDGFEPQFITYSMNLQRSLGLFQHLIVGAVHQANISANNIQKVIINYPSLSEQQSIVATLDSLKSKVDRLQENYNKISQECDALKQAILRQVFE